MSPRCLLVILRITVSIALPQSSKPNILFILADDLGWANVGYHNDLVNTPNIDYLVAHGLELNRHYAHYICAPTRSSIQSGRLPVHVHLEGLAPSHSSLTAGVPINMTCIAERLNYDADYNTYFVGKWDAGSTVLKQTPFGRGYHQTFGYLNHMNDYWNQFTGPMCNGQHITDLWQTIEPAYGQNHTGEYEEAAFARKVYEFIDDTAQNLEQPFFIFYASHIAHSPLQIPKEYLHINDNDANLCQNYHYNSQTHNPVYPGFNVSSDNWHCRSIYQSMVNYLDLVIGNITEQLKSNGQWDNTLIIFAADNGGLVRLEETAASNYPWRGGKFVPFEGGIRVNAFVSGGFLPESRRGQIEDGMMHICDWYHTLCYLAGLDPMDHRAARAHLPPIDSMNMWPLISGTNSTSPRREIAVDNHTLIYRNFKFINRTLIPFASWGGPVYPNATSNGSIADAILDCTMGCLFDIIEDPTEHKNLVTDLENKDIAREMNAKLDRLKLGYYSNNETGIAFNPSHINMSCQCWAALNIFDGFWGPCQYLPLRLYNTFLP